MQTTVTKTKKVNNMVKDSKKLYEFYIVLSPASANEEGTEESLIKLIEKHGGEIKDQEKLSKSELAYPMEGRKFAYKGSIYFNIKPENIQEIEEELKSSEIEILRWMITLSEERKIRKTRTKPSLEKELEVVEKAINEPEETPEEEEKLSVKSEDTEKTKKDTVEESASSIEDIDKKLDEIMGNL